jgi:hypothetical protein
LYLVAAGTGFRANALANLPPNDFDLNADSPTVTLPARFAKNRKTKVQPLPADVADELRSCLAGKPTDVLIWGGTWASGCTGAEMIRSDLEAAGIAYAVDGPDGPEYADFHSLRHSFLTLGGRSGIDLRTLQELAGHSDPKLTARYSHRRLYDLAGAVEKLPNLVPTRPDAGEIPLRLTGTDGERGVVPGVVPGVVTGGAGLHQSALLYTFGIFGRTSDDSTQPLESQGAGASLHRPASNCTIGTAGIRTQNQGIMSQPSLICNPISEQQVTNSEAAGRSAGRSDMRDEQGEGGTPDADLAALVAAWPTLPERIKAAIRALIGTA